MKIALCDDNDLELKKVSKTVDEFITSKQSDYHITVQVFSNGNDLLDDIEKHGSYDLLILDVLMPGMSGIEIATDIRKKNTDCNIIFLTGSPEFAVSSYKVNALYYLVKPFVEDELKSLLEKALVEIAEVDFESIVVKEKGKLTRVKIHTIKYVESVKHNMDFHLTDNSVISCCGTMNEYGELLLSDNCFIKCHKSYIVNMNCVRSISGKDFIMDDKTLIPISKQVYPKVKAAYIDYFFKRRTGATS